MSEPIISVVIPTYNSSRFITKALDCLKTQTFRDFEVVIVNDGSNDDTSIIISDYIVSHPDLEIRLFNQENKGIAGARNRGILEAKGHCIAFLDHDDIWYADKLSKCLEILKKYPEIDLVCHDELMRDSSGRIVRYFRYGPYDLGIFRRLLFKENYLSTSAAVVRKEALFRVGLFREYPEFSTVEDYDLWIRLSRNHKFYFIPDVLGEFGLYNTNASLDIEKHFNNLAVMLKKNFQEYSDKRFTDSYLINLRLVRIYSIITRHFFSKVKLKEATKYFFKMLLQIFSR